MLTLRADENRYLVFAAGSEPAAIRQFPGARFNAQQRCWVFPRQQGLILALDATFGADGWQHAGDLEIDLAEARGRRYPPAQFEAQVSLDGSQLAVECAVADKELVKLVPGYRWSPVQRRWFVAAQPMALAILRERFGDRLVVSPEAAAYVALRKQDEEAAAERSELAPAPPAPLVRTSSPRASAGPATEGTPTGGWLPPGDDPGSLVAALSGLADAVARLEAKLDRVLEGATEPTTREAAWLERDGERGDTTPPATSEGPDGGEGEWRALLSLTEGDAASALSQANRLLQTTDGDDRELRAVAGIAAERAGEHEQAFRHLSRALETAESLPSLLQLSAVPAYTRTALALLNDDLHPANAVDSDLAFRRAIRDEMVYGSGFEDGALGTAAARGTLDLLVNDRGLRRVDPELSDTCRIAQLLATARGGSRLAIDRVASVLREGSLQPEASALGMILYGNACMAAECVDDWVNTWPTSEEPTLLEDGGWLVELALDVLPRVAPELGAIGAVAVLGCIAPGPAEQATLAQRRQLVALIPAAWPYRRAAEFLAAFRLAAAGERIQVAQHFPGYLQRIGASRLENSAAHLTEVYIAGSSVTGSAVRPVADGPYLESIERWGITDTQPQVLDLLDLLAEGSRPDNLLNALARMIEDASFGGADRFDRGQRKAVYERALAESVRMGHDGDAREAFDRLVRALHDEGATQDLAQLCRQLQSGMKPLRIPSLVVLLELELAEGADFVPTLEALIAANATRNADDDDPAEELKGLIELYPELNAPLQRIIEERGLPGTIEVVRPSIEGRRVLLVGGHKWLQKQASPVLGERWKLRVDWLDPEESKRGQQALQLASGAAELVIINTRCIGHAASGRVVDEARRSGKPVAFQNSHGVGAMLEFVRQQVEELVTAPPERKQLKVAEKKRLLR